MTPVDIENEILLVLKRSLAGTTTGMTVAAIHKAPAAATGESVIWRDVANAVCRLDRMGFAKIVDDEQVGDYIHPLYALTPWGSQAANTVRIQKHNASVAGTQKTDHDSVQEASR